MASSVKVCLKCKHKTSYEGTEPIACEACGAIYRKVEEAMRTAAAAGAAAPSRAAPSAQAPAQASPPVTPPPEAFKASQPIPSQLPHQHETPLAQFVEIMRAESLYPTWRGLVKWFTWFGYAIALLLLVTGAYSFKSGSAGIAFGFFAAAVVVAILARVWRELSLMVADLADAAVRTAASKE